jgi:hypothetical protein
MFITFQRTIYSFLQRAAEVSRHMYAQLKGKYVHDINIEV